MTRAPVRRKTVSAKDKKIPSARELDEALIGFFTKHIFYETWCDMLVVSPAGLNQLDHVATGGKHS